MNISILKNNNYFAFLNNLSSKYIGFYFSFLLHFIILLFAIGLPNFFERAPITIPNIIPIEIVNVAEVTSIPEKTEEVKEKNTKNTVTETKKFNNSNTQEIKKVEIKTKPNIELKKSENIKTPKEDIVIKEKIETPIKLEKEKKTIPDEKIESLPSKKIKTKIKPKTISEIIVKESDLTQVSDLNEIENIIDKILNNNKDKVIQYKQGRTKLFGYFVGEAMKESESKANPKILNQLLSKKLR